ncbi:MAG: S8 family serine peptidase [Planctomycetota bacterium]
MPSPAVRGAQPARGRLLRIALTALLAMAATAATLPAAERVNIAFQPGLSPLEQTQVLVHDGAVTLKRHGWRHGVTAQVSAATQAALGADSDILGIEIDHVVHASVEPVHAQGGGTATGQSAEITPTGVSRIGAAPGIGMNTGTGVVIAIVDSGIDLTHPDLQANIIGGTNIINSSLTANDDNGHGSHCAGIAAAAHNGVGVIGVAPDAKLLAVKVLDSTGSGYDSDIGDGIVWATDNGAQVINLSVGGTDPSSYLLNAVQYAASKDVILCAAAGNSGPPTSGNDDITYPAAYSECIAVTAWCDLDGTSAATGAKDAWGDLDESLASFSCTGPEVAFTAPGVDIYSDYMNGGYATLSGTSMATPHVSGTAALNIVAGKTDIRAAMAANAETVAGTADQVGAGLIRAKPLGPPTVSIYSPADGATVYNTSAVTFTGNAYDAVHVSLTSDIQWSSNLDGALGTGASVSATLSVGDHTITAQVTDSRGLTTSVTHLLHVVVPPPTITVPPAAQTVTVGDTATFSVTATGAGTLTYQWQKNSNNISGANSSTYTTPATVLGDSGSSFRVVVSNTTGPTTSAGAVLTVNPPPNLVTANVTSVGLNAQPGALSDVTTTFTLTNGTGAPVTVTLADVQTWLATSPNGPVSIGAGDTITITIQGNPTGLSAGVYHGTITATNAPGSQVRSIPVTLDIAPPNSSNKSGCDIAGSQPGAGLLGLLLMCGAFLTALQARRRTA